MVLRSSIYFIGLFLSFSLSAQSLDQVELGTIKGELESFEGTLGWVNTFSDSISGTYWSGKEWMVLSDSTFRLAPNDTLEFHYKILLNQVVGEQQVEIRLLDKDKIVLHGFMVQGRFLQADTLALVSYRNEYFPFKSKEQVFNLGAGFTDGTLSKEFVLYNFGGDSLELSNIYSGHEELQFKFHPNEVAHNQFVRMEVTLLPGFSELGFTRENIELWNDEKKLIAVLPIQFTLELGRGSLADERPEIAISKLNHDFKVVKKGDTRNALVTISNVGSDELVIKKIEANCACLTYDLSSDVVPPGQSISLNVKFDATERIGYERKTLAIFSNDPNRSTRVLVFRAHVK